MNAAARPRRRPCKSPIAHTLGPVVGRALTCPSALSLALAFALAFALAPALAPCAHAALTVTDDAGQHVTLAAPAERVVALAPHAVELAYAAGGGAKLVGAVSYSDYPAAAKALPRVGSNTSLDLERIVALKPDLVIVWRHGNGERQLDRLRTLGIPLYYSEPHKLDDVATDLIALGTLMGTEARAQAAAADYRAKIAALRARYANRAPVGVFYEVWADPLMTLNGSQIISDVITLCGGRNVFASLTPLVPTVSTEAVVVADPEAIVTTSSGATRPDAPLPSLAAWRAWPRMTAVARGNLFAIDGDLLSRPAPRLAQGAELLCRDLQLARERRPAADAASAH